MSSPYQNEPMASVTHAIGFVFAVVGFILLLVFASLYGTVWHIIGFSVFGTSMVLLYLASTLYHWLPITHRAKALMQKVDHSMIFVLIAGTYTPIALLFPQREWGWVLFGGIWGLTAIGIFLKAGGFHMNSAFTFVPYWLMGWMIVVILEPLAALMPKGGMWWLVAGGVAYSIGTLFYALDFKIKLFPWFGMHEVFHLFVMLGTFAHFWMIFRYLLYV